MNSSVIGFNWHNGFNKYTNHTASFHILNLHNLRRSYANPYCLTADLPASTPCNASQYALLQHFALQLAVNVTFKPKHIPTCTLAPNLLLARTKRPLWKLTSKYVYCTEETSLWGTPLPWAEFNSIDTRYGIVFYSPSRWKGAHSPKLANTKYQILRRHDKQLKHTDTSSQNPTH
jgi:hypothetical protein